MRTGFLYAALLAVVLSCGGDDDGDGDDSDGQDQSSIDGGDDDIDAGEEEEIDGAPGGTQDLGQFCDTLPDNGGPFCAEGECCDKVCREPTDCEGSPGYLPCDEGSDCGGGLICCDVPSAMVFCTKTSSCDDYGGTEIP